MLRSDDGCADAVPNLVWQCETAFHYTDLTSCCFFHRSDGLADLSRNLTRWPRPSACWRGRMVRRYWLGIPSPE